MKNYKTKLYKVEEFKNDKGEQIIRLQSQLNIGKDFSDFILRDSVLECWGKGEKGFSFYPIKIEFEIIELNKN